MRFAAKDRAYSPAMQKSESLGGIVQIISPQSTTGTNRMQEAR